MIVRRDMYPRVQRVRFFLFLLFGGTAKRGKVKADEQPRSSGGSNFQKCAALKQKRRRHGAPRILVFLEKKLRGLWLAGLQIGSAMNRFANALVGAAAADVAAHELVNVGVRGFWFLAEQRNGGQSLPGLTVAALGNVFFHPCLLHGVAAVGGKPFDRGDFLSGHGG